MTAFTPIKRDTTAEPAEAEAPVIAEIPDSPPITRSSARTRRASSSEVQARTDEALAKLRERTERSVAAKRNIVESRVLQTELPFWNDDNRGVPNPFIRSGIFSVGRVTDERRSFVKKLEVPSLSNYSINYTGAELHQDDLDVWMSLINMARAQHISDSVLFTGYELIRDLGWTKNGSPEYRV